MPVRVGEEKLLVRFALTGCARRSIAQTVQVGCHRCRPNKRRRHTSQNKAII
jgi:hypothetical protein